MSDVRTYTAITPARDEEANLARLGDALSAQTVPPAQWIVVDSGSRDGTRAVVARLAGQLPLVRLVSATPAPAALPGAPIVRAFHAGLDALEHPTDVVVKLDADVSFDPTYFEQTLAAFARNPRLGIAGGACLEQSREGAWRDVPVSGGHVRGAVRAYRASCLAQLLPLVERMGWDTIDELTANALGWETATVPGLAFRHHRKLGARDGSATARWRAQGEGAHYIGYRPSYLLLRTLHHARRDPAALAMAAAYLRAAATRTARHPDPRVRSLVRANQALRRLAARGR